MARGDDGSYAPAGGSDPFSYTGGSLLTPWTDKFQWGGGTPGGYSPPALDKFEFGQFNYAPPGVGRFGERAPEAEKYADFVAPDAETFKQDPGYQFRLKEGSKALQNSAAARGTLLTGATAKALQGYGQEQASQEYGAAYGRALQGYGVNRDTSQQYFGNRMSSFGGNLNAFSANRDAALGEGSLGLQAATAGYDRNLSLARTQWQDAADAANRGASAASGNSAADYNRQLNEYKMNYGIFNENQDRQYSKLMGMAGLGQFGAGNAAAYGSAYGGNMANIYGQQGNAQAAGQMGSANAWGGALGGIGNGAMNIAAAYYAGGQGGGGSIAGGVPSGLPPGYGNVPGGYR